MLLISFNDHELIYCTRKYVASNITNLTFLRKLVEFTVVDVEVWRYLIQHDGRLSHFRKHVEEFLSNRYLCWITGLSLAPRFLDFYIFTEPS